MRAFEFMRQIDVHIDRSNGLLSFLRLVTHRYGVGNGLNTNLFNVDSSAVELVLNIFHAIETTMSCYSWIRKPLDMLPGMAKNAIPTLISLLKASEQYLSDRHYFRI